MKKLMTMLLLLLLLIGCAKEVSAETMRPVDPVLTPADDAIPPGEKLVEGMWLNEFVGKELIITQDGIGKNFVFNLSTGEMIPLVCEEYGKVPSPEFRMWYQLSHTASSWGKRMAVLFSQYIGVGIVVDKETGICQMIHFGEAEEYEYVGVTPDDRLFGYNDDRLTLFNEQGEVISEQSFTKEWPYGLEYVHPLEDGFLLVFKTVTDAWQALPAEDYGGWPSVGKNGYSFVVTDSQLQVCSVKTIRATFWEDMFPWHSGLNPNSCIPGSDACLLAVYNSALYYDTKSGNALVLVGGNGEYEFIRYDDSDATTKRRADCCYAWWARPCGVSEDGGYALMYVREDGYGGLYEIDLKTMKVTLQMTSEELESINFSANDVRWSGGEYLSLIEAFQPGTLYRLVDRSTLPAE